MEKTKKNAALLVAFAGVYAALCILGSSLNYAIQMQSFGFFLSDFVSELYGVFVFAMAVILVWAVKVLKGKDTIVSEKIMAWLLAGVFVWVFCGSLSYYIRLIANAVKYDYPLSEYEMGNIAINVLWTLSTIGFFCALKFQKIICAFFKDMKGGKAVNDGGEKCCCNDNCKCGDAKEEQSCCDAPVEKKDGEKPSDPDEIK